MFFEEFSSNKHDYHKIAEFIFFTDSKTYSKVFKSRKKAILAIEKLLLIENDFNPNNNKNNKDYKDFKNDKDFKNNKDYKDFKNNKDQNEKNIKLFVIMDENINKNIVGILHIVKGVKISLWRDSFFVFKNLPIRDAIRFSFIYFLDFLTLSKINQDDYYIAELAIDESQRRKGIATKILKKAVKKVEEENYNRIILDVDSTNEKAIKLYESFGFKKFGTKKVKFFKKEKIMYNMEYVV